MEFIVHLQLVLTFCTMVVNGEPPPPTGLSGYGMSMSVQSQPMQPDGSRFGERSSEYGAPVPPQPQLLFNQQNNMQMQYLSTHAGMRSVKTMTSVLQEQGYPESRQSFSMQQRNQPGAAVTRQPDTVYGQPMMMIANRNIPAQGLPQTPQIPVREQGKIHKHIYVHIAPDEPEEPKQPRERKPTPPPDKHYRILFIKAPTPSMLDDEEIQLPPPPMQKTLVYVLLQNSNFGPGGLNLLTPKPPKLTKPEVYFIRYKNRGQMQPQNGGQVPENVQRPKPNNPTLPPQGSAPSQPPPKQQYGSTPLQQINTSQVQKQHEPDQRQFTSRQQNRDQSKDQSPQQVSEQRPQYGAPVPT